MATSTPQTKRAARICRIKQHAKRNCHEVAMGGFSIYVFDHIGRADGLVPTVLHIVTHLPQILGI